LRWYDRLRRSSEIAFVRKRGRRAVTATFSAYAVPAQRQGAQVAVTVSKAVGSAVVRNRVRRRIRGALDALPAPARPLCVLFVAKAGAGESPYARLSADVSSALGRLVELDGLAGPSGSAEGRTSGAPRRPRAPAPVKGAGPAAAR